MSGKKLNIRTMDPGTYYIGDLCYVIEGDDWDNLVDLCYPNEEDTESVDGVFELSDGRKIAIFSTAHGDGSYPVYDDDFSGISECTVDSGSIGCIRVDDDITNHSERLASLGLVCHFDKPFDVWESNGTIHFGSVCVETSLDNDYENDEEE